MIWFWLIGALFEINAAGIRLYVEYGFLKEKSDKDYIRERIGESLFFNGFLASMPFINIIVGIYQLVSAYVIFKRKDPYVDMMDLVTDLFGKIVDKIIALFDKINKTKRSENESN